MLEVARARRARAQRLSSRSAFISLRRSPHRARSGPVAVHFHPASPDDEARRVAYAVPRRVGTAVERNRCRRRLRAVADELTPVLPPGSYLIGVDAGICEVSFQELRKRVIEAMKRASGEDVR